MANFEEPVQEEEVEFNDVDELGQEEQQEPQAAEEPAVEENLKLLYLTNIKASLLKTLLRCTKKLRS